MDLVRNIPLLVAVRGKTNTEDPLVGPLSNNKGVLIEVTPAKIGRPTSFTEFLKGDRRAERFEAKRKGSLDSRIQIGEAQNSRTTMVYREAAFRQRVADSLLRAMTETSQGWVSNKDLRRPCWIPQ